ncbi:MAG: aminopeptidase [Euryarchaeota archaeon]|nr:aminopeptidase [Euryarchaeota archaeon]
MEARDAAKNALLNVLEAAPGERIVVVCDDKLIDIGRSFAEGALDIGLWTRIVVLDSSQTRHEVPANLHEIFASQNPDIFINLLRGTTEETPFRIKVTKMETRRRVRLGHCPGVTYEMLTDGALALDSEKYKKMQIFADKLMMRLGGIASISITDPNGTDLRLGVEDRAFFTDTKVDWKTLKWMNLPVGEVIVAPIENAAGGRLFCDSAIGGIGKLTTPVEIEIKDGKVEKLGGAGETGARIKKALDTDAWSNVIGEFAFGINPSARFSDEFLETEKILGTCHIAFGNNVDFPSGRNCSMNHMDFLFMRPTVRATYKTGETFLVVKDGKFVI